MKFLLVAVNAKYIHSNPAVYSLKAYAESGRKIAQTGQGGQCSGEPGLPCVRVEIAEYTINNQTDQILEDIYRRKPDVVGFSCYIWNREVVLELARDLHKILPDVDIWLGGPEVSFDAPQLLEQEPEVLGVMKGEGEETFAGLLDCYGMSEMPEMPETSEMRGISGVPETVGIPEIPARGAIKSQTFWQRLGALAGVAYRDPAGEIRDQGFRPVMDLSRVPFPYGDLDGFEHRIVYYESSRGCPFSCSYCLSSVDRTVRFRDWELVKLELDFFLERRVPQVKFVDRTFNCKKSHAMAIWRYILEKDNGVTNFHFEIGADLLDEEELELLGRMRPGAVQLEIGVQSTNPATLREIRRTMDLDRVRQVVARIHEGHNIHQHLDLIAGLPFEDYESFHRSFCDVYAMKPEQLQLGFLKVLKGSAMRERADRYGLVCRQLPPYEVLRTRWLSYEDVRRLKGIEDMVEVYYNSGQFPHSLAVLEELFPDPFILYERLARYYEEQGWKGLNHSRLARYENLYRFGEMCLAECARGPSALDGFADALMMDLYLRENSKSRPYFAPDPGIYKERIRQLAPEIRQLGTRIHVEVLRSGEVWLFDYRERDPLTRNAAMRLLGHF